MTVENICMLIILKRLPVLSVTSFFFHYRRPLMIVVETFYQLHEQENWKANSLNSRGTRTERSHCGATFDTLRYIPEELPILIVQS